MPNIHFMITSLPPTRGCEEPFELGIDVEGEVAIGVVEGATGGEVGEVPGGGVGELLEEILEESGAVQHLVPNHNHVVEKAIRVQ